MQKFTPEQKEKRRIRHIERLANRTPEKVEADRIATRVYNKRSYAKKTLDQKEAYLHAKRQYLLNLSPEKKQARLDAARKYILNLSPEKKQARIDADKKYKLRLRLNESPEKKQARLFSLKQNYRNRIAFIRKKGWEKNSPTGTFFKLVLTLEQEKEVNAYVRKCTKEEKAFKKLKMEQGKKKLQKFPPEISKPVLTECLFATENDMVELSIGSI